MSNVLRITPFGSPLKREIVLGSLKNIDNKRRYF
jgi:hypothetical protein